ncbi:hypothetical protein J5N97_026237 [Dioscorea zingiberensis]|uniref:Aminotransferase-like plant mobile domain-containing protein n=1 Tax=Dioscorea zingiberensis TaxID=325984 RepID=A0A9D5C2A9_9LILI|nr:hypothetical protein J5N97_026237 [Dioscorea zingiberensis]
MLPPRRSLLGLPINGPDVESILDRDGVAGVDLLVERAKMTPSALYASLMKKPAGEDFTRMLLLYIIATIIRPTSNNHIPSTYLSLLPYINEIKNLNWAKYAHEGVLAAVWTYKRGQAKAAKYKRIGGCVWLLQEDHSVRAEVSDLRRDLGVLKSRVDEISVSLTNGMATLHSGMDRIEQLLSIYMAHGADRIKTGDGPSQAHQQYDVDETPRNYIEPTACQLVLMPADVQPSAVPPFNIDVTEDPQDLGGVHIPKGNRTKKEQPVQRRAVEVIDVVAAALTCDQKGKRRKCRRWYLPSRLSRMILDTVDRSTDDYVDYFYKLEPFTGDVRDLHHVVKLKAFSKFENTTETLSATTLLIDSKLSKGLR